MNIVIKLQQIQFNWLRWRFQRRSPSFSAVLSSAHFVLEKGKVSEIVNVVIKISSKVCFGKSKSMLLCSFISQYS